MRKLFLSGFLFLSLMQSTAFAKSLDYELCYNFFALQTIRPINKERMALAKCKPISAPSFLKIFDLIRKSIKVKIAGDFENYRVILKAGDIIFYVTSEYIVELNGETYAIGNEMDRQNLCRATAEVWTDKINPEIC